jgi:hypothetical protein
MTTDHFRVLESRAEIGEDAMAVAPSVTAGPAPKKLSCQLSPLRGSAQFLGEKTPELGLTPPASLLKMSLA